MVKLTTKQKIVLEAIEYYINEYGISPTVKEIAEMTNTATHPAHEKIIKLEEKGVISTKSGCARSIRVLIPLEVIENDEY